VRRCRRPLVDRFVAVVVDPVAGFRQLRGSGSILVVAVATALHEDWSIRIGAATVEGCKVEVAIDGIASADAIVIPIQEALYGWGYDGLRVCGGGCILPAVWPNAVARVTPLLVGTRAFGIDAGRREREQQQSG
jgi:hypothetical protein